MSKSKSAQRPTQDANHHANQLNPNFGTNGTNPANGHVHGNRSKQISQRSDFVFMMHSRAIYPWL